MIIYPDNWKNIGQPIDLKKIEDTILEVLSGISCNSLSFSGGLDSSLLLYFMAKIHKKINAFTIGLSDEHPDVKYAEMMADKYPQVMHKIYIPWPDKIKREQHPGQSLGDTAVRLFYGFVSDHTDGIIAGDGVDEFMCGYYAHQKNPNEEIYYTHMRQLNKEHLIPLDRNSGDVKVYLPFLDNKLVLLLSQIPIVEKVDVNHRKKLMIEMAIGKIPDEIIERRKYGFCDAFKIKGGEQ